MSSIVIYSTTGCVYCACLHKLFQKLKIPFHQIDLYQNPEKISQLAQKTGGQISVPQVFYGGIKLGVCNSKKNKRREHKISWNHSP
jgi:glutaredoxin 3